jgi:uncharacterized protein YdiU (UPF0061 family)
MESCQVAETLLPLLDPDPKRAVELANEAISAFTSRFQAHWLAGMRDKLGLSSNDEVDLELAHSLLRAMYENAADFTLTFRRLGDPPRMRKLTLAYGPCLRTPQPTTVGSRGGDRVWPLRSLNPTHALRP